MVLCKGVCEIKQSFKSVSTAVLLVKFDKGAAALVTGCGGDATDMLNIVTCQNETGSLTARHKDVVVHVACASSAVTVILSRQRHL